LSFVRHSLEEASGNTITLDLGDGRFISYEHLMAGSIRVAVGDRVRRGQVIAQVGYSGSGSSPHLHTHVSDGPSPLAGEGVPWMVEEFVLLGSYASIAAFADGGPWSPPARGMDTARRMELPAPNVVVVFRQRAPEPRP
ncbi:MAG: M23 family metallopeptidase, partial [Longimicrobiales bacterium]